MEQDNQYNPGSEPVSTDDLIFQIGEKEVDLNRKRKAISLLIDQVNSLLQTNKELNEQADVLMNNNKNLTDKLEKLQQQTDINESIIQESA